MSRSVSRTDGRTCCLWHDERDIKPEGRRTETWYDKLEVKSRTNDVVEETVRGLRRQRVDEEEKFTQQKDEFVLSIAVSQFLEEQSEEERRLLDETVPDHLLSHGAHFTHTHTHTHHIISFFFIISHRRHCYHYFNQNKQTNSVEASSYIVKAKI